MTEFQRDYLPPPPPVQVPDELAVLIVRKAIALAEQFQERAIDQMVRDARRALDQGTEPRQIIRQLNL